MHRLIQLDKIIEKRTGSLKEEIEMATNVQLSPLYIADRRDEVEFLEWTRRVVGLVLNHVEEKQGKLVTSKERQEITDIIEFETFSKRELKS
jgi:hypothetical protein